MRSSIQPCGRTGSAHESTTSAKARSILTSNRRMLRRNDRETIKVSSGMTPLGSGDHHPIGPVRRIGIGNNPCVYAYTRVSGSRSAPTATRPCSSAESTDGNPHTLPTSPRSVPDTGAKSTDAALAGHEGDWLTIRAQRRSRSVIVETLTRLPSEVTRSEHPAQHRLRAVVRISELLIERVEDCYGGVEADEVE